MDSINQIHLGYFSPTLNGAKIGQAIADGLSSCLDVPIAVDDWQTPADRVRKRTYSARDLCVFVMPVYAGRLPNLLLPFVKSLRGNETPAVAVVSYGNRNYDDGLSELSGLLTEQGFIVFGGAAFPAEHSFSTILAKGRPDAADLAAAEKFGQKLGVYILSAEAGQLDSVEVPGNWPPGPYFRPQAPDGRPINILKIKPEVNDDCIKCGLCARVCPTQAIDPADVSHVPGKCMSCCACIKRCPVGARAFVDEDFWIHVHDLEERFSEQKEIEFFAP
ncbi:MAG: EFR1 family ferrodoxin [Fastidiosipilaceae bacterium]|jgi:ferredoxin|nr:4Fe-4S binding protein [Clostridiaceae bacterium]